MAAIVLAMLVVDAWGIVIDVLWCLAAPGGFILFLEFLHHLVILAIFGYMPSVFAAYCTIW